MGTESRSKEPPSFGMRFNILYGGVLGGVSCWIQNSRLSWIPWVGHCKVTPFPLGDTGYSQVLASVTSILSQEKAPTPWLKQHVPTTARGLSRQDKWRTRQPPCSYLLHFDCLLLCFDPLTWWWCRDGDTIEMAWNPQHSSLPASREG